jgi:hypothetical protein
MNIESILGNIANDVGLTPDEVRESNVDELFKKEDVDDFDEAYEELFKYVNGNLGKDYRFDYRWTQPRFEDICSIILVRKLREKSTKKGGASVQEHHWLESEILELSNAATLSMVEDPTYLPEIRKVGNILERVKQVYEQMEAYHTES